MKDIVFIKKNVFTFVMFGAIFAFAIYQSIFPTPDLTFIPFLIAIPTFLLSLLKLIADILEDINDRITLFLDEGLNRCDIDENDVYWKLCDEKCEVDKVIQEYYESSAKDLHADSMKTAFLQYHKARILRRRVRRYRRGILYGFYFVFLLMIIALFLHAELTEILIYCLPKNVDLSLITLWSLIIVLVEIMLKDIIEDAILYELNKRIGGYGEWC